MPAATPVLPLTRAVFVLGICLTAGTGAALFLLPDRTDEYWAWTIAAAPSAAFFGAGYLGAAVALTLASLSREWREARVIAVLAFTLTSLALVVTLVHLEPFSLGAGGLTGAIAAIWLAVYVTLPPLALVAYVLQERAGGAAEYDTALPLLRSTQLLLGGASIVLGVVGLALLVDWSRLSERWPWPLTPLTAGLVGTWVITYAVGLLWCTRREHDWRRSRIAVPPLLVTLALDLVAVVRLRDDLDGGSATALYVAGLGLLGATVVGVALVEEGRLREAVARQEAA